MAWIFLILAGGLEIFWATFLKLSEGFSKLGFSALTVLGMLASFFFLSQATKTLPPGDRLCNLDRDRRAGCADRRNRHIP